MKKVITMLMGLSSLLSASATETETPQLPDNVPGLTQVVELTWYEIDPGVRTYLILLSAVTMELSAELPGGRYHRYTGAAVRPDAESHGQHPYRQLDR